MDSSNHSNKPNREPSVAAIHEVEVLISGLASGGDCVGQVTSKDSPLTGLKVFVAGTVPGELIRAQVEAPGGGFAAGRLLKVLKPSSKRVAPNCQYFDQCGGCQLQHIEVEEQRRLKRDMVEGMLSKQAKLQPTNGVILIGADLPTFGYRSRITLHLDRSGQLGFFRHKSAEVVDISECLIANEALNQTLARIRPLAATLASCIESISIQEHLGSVYVVLREYEQSPCHREKYEAVTKQTAVQVLVEDGRGKVRFGSKDAFPAGHFAQVNNSGNELLKKIVLEQELGDEVTEFYAGSGNISLVLAANGKRVEAVEADNHLVRFGQKLAQEAGVSSRLTFFTASAEQFVKEHAILPSVLLDPPRSGAKEVVKSLAQADVKFITYVSCNLPTLCRDLRTLADAGFVLEKVQVLDLFPQTGHVEMVATCSR